MDDVLLPVEKAATSKPPPTVMVPAPSVSAGDASPSPFPPYQNFDASSPSLACPQLSGQSHPPSESRTRAASVTSAEATLSPEARSASTEQPAQTKTLEHKPRDPTAGAATKPVSEVKAETVDPSEGQHCPPQPIHKPLLPCSVVGCSRGSSIRLQLTEGLDPINVCCACCHASRGALQAILPTLGLAQSQAAHTQLESAFPFRGLQTLCCCAVLNAWTLLRQLRISSWLRLAST